MVLREREREWQKELKKKDTERKRNEKRIKRERQWNKAWKKKETEREMNKELRIKRERDSERKRERKSWKEKKRGLPKEFWTWKKKNALLIKVPSWINLNFNVKIPVVNHKVWENFTCIPWKWMIRKPKLALYS